MHSQSHTQSIYDRAEELRLLSGASTVKLKKLRRNSEKYPEAINSAIRTLDSWEKFCDELVSLIEQQTIESKSLLVEKERAIGKQSKLYEKALGSLKSSWERSIQDVESLLQSKIATPLRQTMEDSAQNLSVAQDSARWDSELDSESLSDIEENISEKPIERYQGISQED